ncbi:MAG TPA: hypothetical protein PLC94_12065, partial [bacterium]|nr:hypothetical protein [bacterium]
FSDMRSPLLFVSLLFSALPAFAQTSVAELKNFEMDKIYVKGFSVSKNSSVHIKGIGVMSDHEKWYRWNPMIAYGWIINADTRELVWTMDPSNVTSNWNSRNIVYEGNLTLAPGNYEAYYTTTGQKVIRISRSQSYFNQFFKNLANVFVDDADLYENADEWLLQITSDERPSNFGSYDGALPKTVFLNLCGARDSDYREKGFTLERDIKVKVYCNGEGQDRRMYDYGWIAEDKSSKTVWEMRFDNTEHGGGAEKNRLYRGIITLPAGNYVATFLTDDSHSFMDWNMQPPYDPSSWGMMLSVVDERDLDFVREYKKAKKQEILSITGVGDEQFRSEGLSLSRKTDLHIFALGEGRENRMYDYGWIVNARDGNTIWEMRFRDTKFAGGADKNRLFDGVVSLPAGEYMVYYRTDGSHSAEDWNDDPPYNQQKWGITLSLVNNSDASSISKLNELPEDNNILAQIVRVGDDEYETRDFSLNRATEVRIQCIGEGRSGRMYDYGWIKNAETGQTVWKMLYEDTEPAGGARKNRSFNGVVLLAPGNYKVTFISDDSHSYEDWNDDPPNLPDRWGITVRVNK